jgi:hypothetical protein
MNRAKPKIALKDVKEDAELVLERNCRECIGRMFRARARYQRAEPGCEADYRAAFVLDARLTSSEFVRELDGEIRNNFAGLLLNCRARLLVNSKEVVTLVRLGLTLLMLEQDDEAFIFLQRAFVQNPLWRPLLRDLVNRAKVRRAGMRDTIGANQ